MSQFLSFYIDYLYIHLQIIIPLTNTRFKDKTKHPTYGRHLSDEQKQRLSECSKQRTGGKNPSSKRVIRLSDGKIYDYLASAAEENHMCKDTMTKRCKLHKDFMYYNEWIEQQNNLNNNKGDD